MRDRSYAYGKNHFLLDPDLYPILDRYWPEFLQHREELRSFGKLAGETAYEVADHVDRASHPQHIMHDLDGERVDRVLLSPAHAQLLKDIVFINRPPYEGGSWHHHFVYGYLLADPGLYCSLIVTNQTAYAIYKYAPQHRDWLDKILSGEAWGATWMTETQGGSDLGANTTQARLGEDGWSLYSDTKYFASNAGLADVALVTARPENAPSGPKGLALFLVPRLRPGGGLNFTLRRLKDKSATRAVPTGEVEFDGSHAFLIGDTSLGIYYTLETLTVSRLANAIGAMGLARKAHLESHFRVHSRTAFGKRLVDHPLVRLDLTDLAVRTAGGLCLVFHAINAFDQTWLEQPPYTISYHYARFLSHLAKNRTAEHAARTTLTAMELFGGLGFLEETVIPRLHREALVTAIWEGSSNIQALDLLETIGKKGAHESFLDEFVPLLKQANTWEAQLALSTIEKNLDEMRAGSHEETQWFAKDYLRQLADSAQVALLYSIANHGGERYAKLGALYSRRFLAREPYPSWALDDKEIWGSIREEVR